MQKKFFSTAEAADICGKSEQYIRRMLKAGRISGCQIGKTWVITESKRSLEEACVSKVKLPKVQDQKNSMIELPQWKMLSFFSGAMGLDIGLEKVGFVPLLTSEIDDAARATILANHPNIGLLGDIRNFSKNEIFQAAGLSSNEEVDLMVGGPPCQSFSTAGKRLGINDARGNLLLYYINLILEIKPRIAVIENVRGLLSAPLQYVSSKQTQDGVVPERPIKGGVLKLVIDMLRSGGYGVSFNLYNAANFGAPQIRERIVILCCRDGRILPYLEPTHSENTTFNLPPWKTLQDALKGLPKEGQHYIKFPEKRLRFYRLLTAGQNWKDLPADLQPEAMGASFHLGGGKTGFYRRLAWDKPSPTLVTHPAMPATDLCHPSENRPLSIEEYKRIQEFPDDWTVCGSLLEQYKQVGNAVPVSLGIAIGKAVKNTLEGKNWEVQEGFPFSRYKKTGSIEWERMYNLSRKQAVRSVSLFDIS